MRVLHLSKRVAAAGVATALDAAGVATALDAAGVVVGIATPATAATATSDYLCAMPSIGSFTFPVTVDVPNPDNVTSVPAGFTAPESFLNLGADHAVDMTFSVPADLVPILASFGTISSLSSPDFGMSIGDAVVPVGQMTLGTIVPGDAGALLIHATGTNGAFSAPTAGTYDITMPSAFTMVPAIGALGPVPISCTTDSPATMKSITVTKNRSTAIARPAVVPFHKGKAAKMRVTVSAPNHTPAGKVTIKQGTKTFGSATLSSLGKAVVNMGSKLALGSHKVVVSYPGDGYTKASRKTLTFKVVR